MVSITYADDLGTQRHVGEIPADYLDAAQMYREQLIEALAELDDELMAVYLGGAELTEEQLKQAIRKATLSAQMVPVLCGSSFRTRVCNPCWMRWWTTYHHLWIYQRLPGSPLTPRKRWRGGLRTMSRFQR